jgi:hypothetical protein
MRRRPSRLCVAGWALKQRPQFAASADACALPLAAASPDPDTAAVLPPSARRDRNGKLRTISRTSVCNPAPERASFCVIARTVGLSYGSRPRPSE